MTKLLFVIIILITLMGCTPRGTAGLNGGNTVPYKIDKLPADICVRDGVPVVINVSSEIENGKPKIISAGFFAYQYSSYYFLTYVNRKGEMVTASNQREPVVVKGVGCSQ